MVEFQVNSFATNNQDSPAIARDAAGNFVVVWQSANQDGSGNGIYAQRFDSSGNRLGSEFQINSFTNGSQETPVVAMDAAGNFVVAWLDRGRPLVIGATTRNEIGIYARRFNSAGVPLGAEFLVDRDQIFFPGGTDPGSYPVANPAIAMNAGGDFIIAWNSGSSVTINPDIVARRYSAAGTPLGGAFQVNSHTPSSQWEPSVAIDDAGNFIVSWTSNGQEVGSSSYGVFARRFSAAGIAQGSDFLVNSNKVTNAQTKSVVRADASGGFVIAWEDFDNGIYAQRYNPDGSQKGAVVLVTSDSNPANRLDLTVEPDGDFVVTWSDYLNTTFARAFTTNGIAKGNALQVPSSPASSQFSPAIASDEVGNFAVTWVDPTQDGNQRGVFARVFGALNISNAADILTGTTDSDIIDGLGGNDTIFGLAGNDQLIGAAGNDILIGNEGNDKLLGGGGRDRMFGGSGRDILRGGNGNDVLKGDIGNDLLDGGKGRDLLFGGRGRDRFVLAARQGRDIIQDFENGRDKLALAGRLGFADLTIRQLGRNTLISAGRDQLALLRNTSVTQITAADFVSI